jgi:DNA-binding NtrC family response regulator
VLTSDRSRQSRPVPAKILVVDDNPDMCQVVADMLEPTGAEVVSALDGTSALGLLEKNPIDLAIIDLLFAGPVSSDLVVQQAKIKNCQVITMSGTLASDRRGRDLQHPHIVKPFQTQQLIDLVAATLARKDGRPSPIVL